jgi:long-chain acyl-CoA synthetase
MLTRMSEVLADVVRGQAAARPADEALVCGTIRLTWRQLNERSSRVANALLGLGVGRGDRVGVLARNNAEFFEVAFGAAKIGAVTVGLNWRLAVGELDQVLADAEPAVLFVDDDSAVLISPAAAAARTVIRYGPEYEGWRESAPDGDPELPVAPGDLAYLLYSSGTTGLPKGVMITHENLTYSRRMAEHGFRMGADTVHMCAGPQFHIAGAGTGLMAMFFGARTIVIRDPDPVSLIDTIARERVTHAFLVPALIQMIADSPLLAEHDVSCLQQVSYGAAPMTEALLRRAMAALGCEFLGVYGMTETAGTVCTLAPEDHDPQGARSGLLRSVGRPLPWVELQVVDTATGAETEPGTAGEIQIRSRQSTPGYWRQPDTTAATIDSEGWLRTGDGAYRDAEGFVYLKDRIKDMIISGGENVYPAEVENVLADHPDVSEVAVIGVPHERWGETVKAVVVLRAGATGDGEAIRSLAKERIAT